MRRSICKALLNGVATLFVLALVLSLVKGAAFAEVLVAPYTVIAAAAACLGNYIGFARKARAVSLYL